LGEVIVKASLTSWQREGIDFRGPSKYYTVPLLQKQTKLMKTLAIGATGLVGIEIVKNQPLE
jgi:hypothetical protein